MKLIDMKMQEYLDVLKSEAPAPGGGSASALAGAEGLALVLMVADLTLSKERYAGFHAVCREVRKEALPVYEELRDGIDRDTEAYNSVAAAFGMPKESEAQKAARSAAIQAGTISSTEVPLRNMELALEGLKLTGRLIGNSNPNAASDLGVAVLNLLACVRGAWLNVKINLGGIRDRERAEGFEKKAGEILAAAEAVAAELYKKVEEAL